MGVNATLKKKTHRDQDYVNWISKFDEMGWDMFLRKQTSEMFVLCR